MPVASTGIASVGYDPAARQLEVEFTSGAVYLYSNVPSTIHRQFISSESLGQYFNEHIRDSYPARKLE